MIGVSLKTPERIRALQRKLYCAAKQQPKRRFHQLYDKIWRSDILQHAWERSRANRGVPGVDGQTFEQIEAQGVEDWLRGVQEELKTHGYRPQAVRRVLIPKAGGGHRPLGLPTIKDRVVQTAAKIVLEPIFEADMHEAAYGYRPKRSGVEAVKRVHEALIEGYTEVLDADLTKYFDNIAHEQLMASVAARIVDRAVLRLIRCWLKVPVQDEGSGSGAGANPTGGRSQRRGTPQGGVISPLLANRYMNRLLRHWEQTGAGQRYRARIVNYADDFVIVSKGRARAAGQWVQSVLERLGLELNTKKTRVCDARSERFEFLGYSLGLHHERRAGRPYLGASASAKAVQRLKDKVGAQLKRQTAPWAEVRDALNRTLKGWEGYFSYGSTRKSYRAINAHVRTRVRNFLQRRHQQPSRGTRVFSHEAIFGTHGVYELGRAR